MLYMIFLQILRFAACVTFIAGTYWLAFYHHHDGTFLQGALVFIPLVMIGLSNWLIIRASKARAP
jgi:hypothetical protein